MISRDECARPYLIVPRLIEQATWGGSYIVSYKGWQERGYLLEKRIGQSHELSGKSKLLVDVVDSDDPRFVPEAEFLDLSPHTLSYVNTISIEELVQQYPREMLGDQVLHAFGKMPLLIKFTQALGNSFQLHIKPSVFHPYWQPKPESWYYFEDGVLTFGVRNNIDLVEYKRVCLAINDRMMELSEKVQTGKLELSEAREEARGYIQELDPWQFVNVHQIERFSVIDLSLGGIHHSWEEDLARYPNGNIVYEIQLDVEDERSTIRCFDKGKFREDGSIREVHINDYFRFIDTDEIHNDIRNAIQTRKGNRLLTTPYYCLDILEINECATFSSHRSFCHLFIKDGDVDIVTENGSVHVGKGHSCFIPYAVREYEILPRISESVILKTYIR